MKHIRRLIERIKDIPEGGIYRSQFGQEKLVDEIFDRNPGFYVDVGAHNGVDFSNSYFLQFRRGWHGICIEPNKSLFQQLAKSRQKTENFCFPFAIDSYSGQAEFIEADWWGTLTERLTPEHDEKFLQTTQKQISIVEVRTLQQILDHVDVSHVNYLSLDTEGNELNVLQGIDWGRTTFDVLGIENNWDQTDVQDYLSERGYHFIKKLGVDDFYVIDGFN